MHTLRIAIGIDMEWPFKHHHDAMAGILLYAKRHTRWQCALEPYLEYPKGTLDPAQHYDGVIARASRRLGLFAARTGLPAVNIWNNSPDQKLPRVVIDQKLAGKMAAGHLVSRGLKHLKFLGLQNDQNSRLQAEAVEETARQAAGSFDALHIEQKHQDSDSWHRSRDAMIRWISGWTPPVGLYATDDLPARYISDLCLSAGLRVPDDVSIIGSGNTEVICESLEPTLTSIELGYDRVGFAAAELLDHLMQGKTPPASAILIPPLKLVPRRSTDVFAVEDRLIARALRVIWDNAPQAIGVDDVVEKLPVTRRSLERRFRKVMGRSLHDEITRSRIGRARQLLLESDDPIQWIAAASGFSGAEQLSKVFRKTEGLTPREFRHRHRSE